MSSTEGLASRLRRAIHRPTSTVLLILIPIVGFLGFLIPLILKLYSFATLSIYLAGPLLAVSLAYLVFMGKAESRANLGENAFKLMLSAFLAFYALSIVLLYAFPVRAVPYYLAVAAMATVVLIQILQFEPVRSRVIVILLQAMALMLNLNWGVTMKYFMFIGRTDLLVHLWYVENLVKLGHVTEVFFDYRPFPLWHILNGTLYMIASSALPAYKIMNLTASLVYLALPPLAFLIAMKVFNDKRVALLAGLLVASSGDVGFISMAAISRSATAILFIFVLLLLLDSKIRSKYVLAFFLMLTIILFHSVSIIFILLILLMIYLAQKVLLKKEERMINLAFLAVATAATAIYWYFNAGILLNLMWSNLVLPAPEGVQLRSALISPLNELINYLQYSPQIFFAVLGVLIVLFSKGFSSRARLISVIGAILIPVSFPGPQLLIGKLATNLGIDRFAEYSIIFLTLLCAIGLGALLFRAGARARAFLIVLFAIWVFLSVSNDFVASDNPLVKRPYYTYYLTEPEITGFEAISARAQGLIMSDHVANRLLMHSQYQNMSTIIEVSGLNQDFLRYNDTGVFIIRDGELEKRPLKLSSSKSGEFTGNPSFDTYIFYYNDAPVYDALPNYDRIYDNGVVEGYN